MYAYIKGELIAVNEEGIILENGGIGYNIKVPVSLIQQLPSSGNEIKIYTYTHVKEDAFLLYGVLNQDDLKMFRQLILVNGIGPKGALGILSAMDVDDLRFAILSNDAKSIAKAPGIGAKTASKLILELKDKVSLEDAYENKLQKHSDDAREPQTGSDATIAMIQKDAVDALTALGYSASDSLRAVRKVEISERITVEDLLKLALKNF